MSRIRIDIPARILGKVTIPVRITDINYGNHVGNDAVVGILHEARVLWLKNNQLSELEVGGCGLIMGDLAVEFINESFYGDVLTVSISAADVGKVNFELFYLLETNREQKTVTIAKGKTGMVCFNYSTRKLATIPEPFRKILTAV